MPISQHLSTLDQAVEALYNLNPNVVGKGASRHEKPHKPSLILAALDLIAEGKARPDRIAWDQQLRDRFAVYFNVVKSPQDECNPALPFRHLGSGGWWQPQRVTPTGNKPLISTPTAAEAQRGDVFASLSHGMDNFTIRPKDRLQLRNSLIARYFPQARPLLLPLFAESTSPSLVEDPTSRFREDEAPATPGRSAGFRRKILEIYDCQCAACGLRIRLPQVDDMTFVDAAHLIPFSNSRNDHPSNGIALCKIHHWAMDRFLIAPAAAGIWKVSRILDERRSDGERSLLGLAEKPVLQPTEVAFAPTPDALRRREERLMKRPSA